MRYIEVGGEIDKNNQLILHELFDQIKPQRVEINIVFRDDDDDDVDVEREPSDEEIFERVERALLESSRGECKLASDWTDIMIETTGEINDLGQLVLDEPLKQAEAQYVDVVIFFIKDEEYNKKFYGSEENIYEDHPALVKESSNSKVPSYAG